MTSLHLKKCQTSETQAFHFINVMCLSSDSCYIVSVHLMLISNGKEFNDDYNLRSVHQSCNPGRRSRRATEKELWIWMLASCDCEGAIGLCTFLPKATKYSEGQPPQPKGRAGCGVAAEQEGRTETPMTAPYCC